MATIGLDLGGTKLAAALFDDDGDFVTREVVPLSGRAGRDVGALLARAAAARRDEAAARGLSVAAVGVAVPGIAYARTGRVWAPNVAGWDDYPLRDELEAALPGLAVRIDSDRACYILGETWRGAAQGCRDAVFVAVGTGIGAGILVDGRVLRGAHDVAGAIGWLALERPYRPGYPAVGCFEYHASGPGLARVARDLMADDPAYAGPLRRADPEALTGEDVFAALDAGDALAARVLDQAVGYWGMAAANLISLFNPEKVIFGGGVFGPAARYLDRIGEEARRWAQPIAARQVTLEASRLGGDAGLYGAGRLAMLPAAD